jgi:hypothetical protein
LVFVLYICDSSNSKKNAVSHTGRLIQALFNPPPLLISYTVSKIGKNLQVKNGSFIILISFNFFDEPKVNYFRLLLDKNLVLRTSNNGIMFR